MLYRKNSAPGPWARCWKNEGFLPRSVLDVVSRVASPLLIAIVVGEAIHHCIEWGFGHALEASRSDEYSAFRSHITSGNPKVFAFIVKFACGGLVNSFHRFYSPFLLCLYYIIKGLFCQAPFGLFFSQFKRDFSPLLFLSVLLDWWSPLEPYQK